LKAKTFFFLIIHPKAVRYMGKQGTKDVTEENIITPHRQNKNLPGFIDEIEK